MIPEIAKHSEKFYYFFEIAHEGSLQATARKLGVAAPSLSQSLKQLEAVAGTQLFVRSKSGVRLTDAGQKLYIFCRKYFREMEEVQTLMEHSDLKALQKIRIGTFQSIALYFWPLLIDSMKGNPHISLSITTNRSHAILESLVRREVDIALTVEDVKHPHVIKHELYRDEYAFYVPKDWKRAELKKGDVAQTAILFIPDAKDENGKSLRQYLHSWNLIFKDEFELDSLEVVGEFVKKGYGVGILPTRVAKTFGPRIKPVRVEGLNLSRFGSHRFFLSYRDDLEIPQSMIKLLLESARKAVADLSAV